MSRFFDFELTGLGFRMNVVSEFRLGGVTAGSPDSGLRDFLEKLVVAMVRGGQS
jgi:hypothetical protein